MWVLRYVSLAGEHVYYRGPGKYSPKVPDLVGDLQVARLFEKYQDVVDTYDNLDTTYLPKERWSILSVRSGWIIDKEDKSHLKRAEIRQKQAKILKLEAELAQLRVEVMRDS